jgi:hypothetical protein
MHLMLVTIKHKKSGKRIDFDVHAKDGEQAIELIWHVIEEYWDGKPNEYEFKLIEINENPVVVSYGSPDFA